MGGELGDRILASICAQCWADWVGQQAILINHYGLQMFDRDDRRKLTEAMKDFLNLEPAANGNA